MLSRVSRGWEVGDPCVSSVIQRAKLRCMAGHTLGDSLIGTTVT